MTIFLRLLSEKDKGASLLTTCEALRRGLSDKNVFNIAPDLFDLVPGSPFAYSVGDSVRNAFSNHHSMFESGISVAEGLNTTDNERFLRLFWEVSAKAQDWVPLAKGGEHSRFYADLHLVVKWRREGNEMKTISKQLYGSETKRIYGQDYYFRPGLTYSQRTQKGLSFRAFPKGAIFNVKGPAVISEDPSPLALLALTNSLCFRYLVELQTSFGSYNVGYLQKTPLATYGRIEKALITLAKNAWSLKRALDTVNEASHAFVLPAALRARLSAYNPPAVEMKLAHIQAEIDKVSFDLYDISDADRGAIQAAQDGGKERDAGSLNNDVEDDSEDEEDGSSIDNVAGLLSWAAGVAFGRFDWRLATGEREAPAEPEPFDPLPEKNPGMLPDGSAPFHAHAGILVDEEGHPHDLAHLVEDVLKVVDAPMPADVRRWLQREFFPFHLKRYSKSRRKAPIYWPLSTLSGSYTLWLYYPDLTSQTLFTAVNDFVEPVLKQVRDDLDALRHKGTNRSKQEEKQLESATDLEQELADLRDTLLSIAPKYSPNHDDGVQITAAPLWPLFNHKPWQKILKETWQKLEQGDYDWAHLAMSYWPERVLRKCHQDRSLAIAHDVEDSFWHEVEAPVKRGKKTSQETKLEWKPKDLSETELVALIKQLTAEMK